MFVARFIKVTRYPKIWPKIIFLVLFCGFYWQILEEREGVVYEVGGLLNVIFPLEKQASSLNLLSQILDFRAHST